MMIAAFFGGIAIAYTIIYCLLAINPNDDEA